jgi:oligopeptide transport system permease protein
MFRYLCLVLFILWGWSPLAFHPFYQILQALLHYQKQQKESVKQGRSLWIDAKRRLFKNRMAMFGLILLAFIAFLSLMTHHIWPYEESIKQDTTNIYQAPSWEHWCGTDKLGRDVFIRIMWGSRISLMVGLIATLVSVCVGVAYGAIAGYFGGALDNFMMRVVDVIYTLPYIFVVILLMVISDRNLYMLFVALGLTQWLTMARIVRGQALSLKEKEFIEAARCSGSTHFQIIFTHIIPNLLGPVIVYSTLTIPQVMLQEAFLSFIGLGIQAPDASWGSLASDGLMEINPVNVYWWLVIFPGLALTLTLFSLNFLGDGLRDALDPQSKKSI